MHLIVALAAAVPLAATPADPSPSRTAARATVTIHGGVRVGVLPVEADAPVAARERVRDCLPADHRCRLIVRDMP